MQLLTIIIFTLLAHHYLRQTTTPMIPEQLTVQMSMIKQRHQFFGILNFRVMVYILFEEHICHQIYMIPCVISRERAYK